MTTSWPMQWIGAFKRSPRISLSLGGAPGVLPFSLGEGRSSGDAANDAVDAGVYVVAAAGNDGEDGDGDVAHPSSEASVISVGGVTIEHALAEVRPATTTVESCPFPF